MPPKTEKTADIVAQALAPAMPPMPEPPGGWPADEFTGVGGSYVRDPLTGLRSPSPVAAE